MNSKIGVLAFLLAINMVAAASISITSTSIPSSVDQGASFTITTYVQGDSVQDVQGTISVPSGITCTPTSAQSISLSNTTSGSGSSSWSCTGDVSGDYSNQITVTTQATPTTGGSAISDSDQTGLTVLAPASIMSSSDLSATSVAVSSATANLLSISVNNAGDVATTVTITPSSSGGTFTPASYTSVSVEGSSIVTKTFTFTAGSTAGSYTITTSVTSPDAGSDSLSDSITITAAATATPTPSPTSGTQQTSDPGPTSPPSGPTPTSVPQVIPSPSLTPTPEATRQILTMESSPSPTPIPHKAEAEAKITAARNEINDAKEKGYDTSEAEGILKTAVEYAAKGDYQTARNYAQQARDIIAGILEKGTTADDNLQVVSGKGEFNWWLIAAIVLIIGAATFSYVHFAEKRRRHFKERHDEKKHKGEIDFME